jgi:hypothetical protein
VIVTMYCGLKQSQWSDFFLPGTRPCGSERSGCGGRPTGRGRGRAHPKPKPALSYLDGPIHDETSLRGHRLDNAHPPLKERWVENPQSAISNYCSLEFGKQPNYEVTEGIIQQRKVYQCVELLVRPLFVV